MSKSKNVSRIAGIFYLVVAITGFFVMDTWNKIIVEGDIATTISNISANGTLFRISLLSNVIMTLAWVMLSLYLYRVFKALNRTASIIMVVLVLLGGCMTLFSTLTKTAALKLIPTVDAESVDYLMSAFFNLSNSGTMFAYIFFGLWLLPLGCLIYKSDISPKYVKIPLSVLVLIAGIGYLIDYLVFQLNFSIDIKVTQFTFYGEVFLLLWLLIKGIDIQESK